MSESKLDALFQAVKADDLDGVKALLESGCDANLADENGETALFRAKSAEMVRLLIDNGADVNHVNEDGETALFGAQSVEIASLLIEQGCDVNHVDEGGRTALFNEQSAEIASLLIEQGCDVNHVNKDGETALFWAWSMEIARLLIEKGGDVNHVSKDGETALFMWARLGDEAWVRVLVEAGAEINCTNIRGETPLSCSSQNPDPEVARLLFEHGANIDQIDKIVAGMDENDLSLQDTRSVFVEYQKFNDLHAHRSVLSLFSDDLKEISGCLSAEAYKASCILAGSVLETFLTDWLSEILGDSSLKHVDDLPSVLIKTMPPAPLTKPLLAKPKNNKSWSKLNAGIQSVNCYHQQKALAWTQFEKMAGFIRDARNSVHGNAHSKSTAEGIIDAEKCQNVLDNLKAIIHSRYWPVERIESAQQPKDRSAEFELLIRAIQEENIELFDSVSLDNELVCLEDKDRKTLCSYAAEAQNTYFLSKVLQTGGDVNHEIEDGETPLCSAARNLKPEFIKVLLEAGADVNHEDKDGDTPLFYAFASLFPEYMDAVAVKSHPDVVRMILVLSMLLDSGADVNHEDRHGLTPLLVASEKSNLGVIKVLLDAGANVNHVNNNGRTPLFSAARNSNLDVVKLFLSSGLDVNHVNGDGETPLFSAARNSNSEVIKLLINAGADVNHVDNNSETPLFVAASNSNSEVIKLLLEAGGDVNHEVKDDGWNHGKTPLFEAVRESNPEIIKVLLDAGADVNYVNNWGETPLLVASASNLNPEVINVLLEAGANVNHKNKRGETALFYAAENSDPEVVKLILSKGLDVNHVANNGETPIFNAASNWNYEGLHRETNPEVIKVLLSAGADIHIVDHKGKTVFDCCKNAEVKRLLYAYDLGCEMTGHEKILEILDGDIQEVASCITARCYKAACIMCGSVLETFLKDWLSEITGKDFNTVKPERINPLLVDNKLLKKEDVNSHRLYNYILATKNYHERLHEDWQDLYDKAVMIRDNRNKVHASLCEDTGYVFDETLCNTVLDNLRAIIRSRFAYF